MTTSTAARKRPPTSWRDLETRFDRLYRRALALNETHADRLCGVAGGQCARSRRTGAAPFCCGGNDDFPHNPRCPHLGRSGCTVQSLRCKLWFCDSIPHPNQRLGVANGPFAGFQTVRMRAFRALLLDAEFYGFLVHRGTRADSLDRAAAKWGVTRPKTAAPPRARAASRPASRIAPPHDMTRP